MSRKTACKSRREEVFFNELPLQIHKSEPLTPKTKNQEKYLHAIENFKVVFGTGPAGTGKTFVAVSWAAEELKAGRVQKLLFTRPAIEVGEKLGYLPGELESKFAPYLTPVIEILNDKLGKSHVENLVKLGKIEATPLGYLRGRTFNDCICILDEAQNTTAEQMKMFLTRFGRNCKMIVEGDTSQKDLKINSGLDEAIKRIGFIPSVKIIQFGREDIVRSGLVEEIVQAWDK